MKAGAAAALSNPGRKPRDRGPQAGPRGADFRARAAARGTRQPQDAEAGGRPRINLLWTGKAFAQTGLETRCRHVAKCSERSQQRGGCSDSIVERHDEAVVVCMLRDVARELLPFVRMFYAAPSSYHSWDAAGRRLRTGQLALALVALDQHDAFACVGSHR